MFDPRNRLLVLAGSSACAWLTFAILAITTLSPATRLLSFALVTGALLVAGLYEMNKKDRAWKQSVLLLTATWLVCGVTLYAAIWIAPKKEFTGPLLAGHSAAPPTACAGRKLASGDLLMIVGRNGVIGHGSGPFMPFRVGSCPALTVTRTTSGLMVNGFGYDSDNNVVYRIRDNVFDQIVGGFLSAHRPDPSRLIIGDDHGARTVDIRYLNENAVEIEGTFRCGDSLPITVLAGGVYITRAKIAQNRCVILGDESEGLTFAESAASHS
jgi:hypothetical protein